MQCRLTAIWELVGADMYTIGDFLSDGKTYEAGVLILWWFFFAAFFRREREVHRHG